MDEQRRQRLDACRNEIQATLDKYGFALDAKAVPKYVPERGAWVLVIDTEIQVVEKR